MNPIKLFFYCIILALVYLGFEQFNLNLTNQGQSAYKNIKHLFQEEHNPIETTGTELKTTTQLHSDEFSCQGFTHCSQMHSCEEAKYYLNHCPSPEMDGDSDGIPCERQWCH